MEVPYLLRRPDGRVLAVSRLLYLVVSELDGRRDLAEVAERASAAAGRRLTAQNVSYLVEHKLRPIGAVDEPGAAGAAAGPHGHTRAPALALAIRTAVLPAGVVDSLARLLAPLFVPAVVAATMGAFVAVDLWLLLMRPISLGTADVLGDPWLVALVAALTIGAGAFHELGHAAAGSYGGARPGPIGVGIYLVWPVFFSDLTDSYRLARAGRLRADLGGVYFNVLFMLLLALAYLATGAQVLLVVIVLHHLLALRQFLPFVRLDGYYLVSDLAGVPDLFARVGPVLASLVPGRSRAGLGDLEPGVRRLVTAWALLTVTALGGALVVLAVELPGLAVATAGYVEAQWGRLVSFPGQGDVSSGLLGLLGLAALAIPVAGIGVPVARLLRRRRVVAAVPAAPRHDLAMDSLTRQWFGQYSR